MALVAKSGCDFGVYVHVPFCHVQCPYCTFYTVPRPERAAAFARFLEAVRREWRLRVTPRLQGGDRLRTLYLGGGTPSDVPAPLLESFLGDVARDLTQGLASLDEVTVECNPETAEVETLQALHARGVDRISLGVQALHASDLRRLGRASTLRQVEDALDRVAQTFDNWSADLILGIPDSNRRRLVHALESLHEHGAPHVSFYCLEMPAERARALGGVPWSERRVASAYEFVSAWLEEKGYEHYEISSAALPGRRARHNAAYWERREYVGLGPGAHSQWGGGRRANRPDLEAYLQALEAGGEPPAWRETLAPESIRGEELMLGLRRREGIELEDRDLRRARPLLDRLGRQGLGTLDGTRFGLTPKGWMVSDSIVLQLLAEFEPAQTRVDKVRPTPLHSV